MKIDRDKIKISLSGGAIGDIVNLFTHFIKGPACDAIEKGAVSKINEEIPAEVNPLIASTDGYVNPIPYKWFKDITLDFQVPSVPLARDNSLQLGVKGNFFYRPDNPRAKDPYGERAPDMPWNNSTNPAKF